MQPWIAVPRPASKLGRFLLRLVPPLAAAALAGCGTDKSALDEAAQLDALAKETRGWSARSLERLTAELDPSTLALARRHDPAAKVDYWGRPRGWETFRLADYPTLGFGTTFDETARRINALKPYAKGPINPMDPFVLRADSRDRARALKCLTQAVYFEAAREPTIGQEAVAQIVLNRVRHPAYPNSVCGVVYQGSARRTGCQFTFTCDGSLAYAPERRAWERAEAVARRALDGFVLEQVGPATHYHADYVAPYWAPTLVKLTRIGDHIFYRWTGPAGEPAAFIGRYRGGETNLSLAVLGGTDARTQGLTGVAPPSAQSRTVTLAVAGEVRTYAVADPEAPGGERLRVAGQIQPSRRQPTAEEVQRINGALAEFEAKGAAPPPAEAPVSP
ncbi:MAG: cell wall hydrolase [Phenylobacterium sp.]|uniref:cell wall hydrolase n=1 Tax=Phenylobacterium sp. TaxID=1871053 RepID=UPI00391AA71A